jgi:hypothetical protein
MWRVPPLGQAPDTKCFAKALVRGDGTLPMTDFLAGTNDITLSPGSLFFVRLKGLSILGVGGDTINPSSAR